MISQCGSWRQLGKPAAIWRSISSFTPESWSTSPSTVMVTSTMGKKAKSAFQAISVPQFGPW